MNTLLLASKSPSRKLLLGQAQIPFVIIEQSADETACDWGLPLNKLVESIALHKMNHAVMPRGKEGHIAFVLTADTLSQDKDGTINGKPIDRDDAIDKIKRARNGSTLCTAFCLDLKKYKNGVWEIEKRIERCVQAEYQFIIPDHWIEPYLDKTMALSASNAIAVEDFGVQFLKMVDGSYSTIVGLPMFELREALEELGFF
jgi:septum formation protein